jgi:hemoglobin
MSTPPINLDIGSAETPPGDGSVITIEQIRAMVERFYTRIQADELLGPIFGEIVQDWEAHYDKMTRFWSSAVLHAGTYSGRPFEAHKFGGLEKRHFERWIELFTQVVNAMFEPKDAAVFLDLGTKMASSIAMRIGTGRLD